jgi:hypothetical protein
MQLRPTDESPDCASRLSETERASGESVGSLIDSLVTTRGEILRLERSLRQALDRLDHGRTTIDEFVLDVRLLVEARGLTDALGAVDEIRRESRRRVYSLALDRGYSIVEMARAWGVPRQLASRYVHEAMSISGKWERE